MQFRQSYFIFIFFLLIPFSLFSQVRVTKVDDSFNPQGKNGLIYALPRAVVQVEVLVEQKELLAGPLKNYAEEFLGISNYIRQDGFEYSLKDIRISTLAEPDPDQYYFVEQGPKSSKETWESSFSLNGIGMITSVGSSLAEPGQSEAIAGSLSEDELMQIFRNYADLNLYARVDTIVRRISIDTITIEDYTFKTTMTEKPLEVKAREVAEMIGRIREGRLNLITGFQEVNYSEGTMRFMNDELLKMENEYMRLFVGAVKTSKLTYTFTYVPGPESLGTPVGLFRLSETSGISRGGGQGEQAMVLIESIGSDEAEQMQGSGNGLHYRIPRQADINILFQGETIGSLRTAIPQLGHVAALPPEAADIEFDGNTGGVKAFKLKAE